MESLTAQTRLLVVAPHPDDETLATGTLIQRVLAAGGSVHVLLLTDGDNNPWPQRWLERRLWIGDGARRRWARRRRGEFAAALRELGVAADEVTALGWPDQGLTRLVGRAPIACADTLAEAMQRFRPNLVAMPALDDRHPDHSAAHVLMRLALARRTPAPEVWLYRVHGAPPVAGASTAWPADARTWPRKRAALACHASQLALSRRRMQRLAARTERFEPLRPGPGREVLPWAPSPLVGRGLRLTAAGACGGGRWRWSAAPLQRQPTGDFRLATGALPASEGVVFAKLELALPAIWIFDHWGWCELRR